jgi:hypothetical protein
MIRPQLQLDTLSQLVSDCPYPPEMEKIERGILGAGFYPGAQGFTSEQFPYGGVLLLGRDFGVLDYYTRLAGEPARDETATTWTRTRDIYIPCFSHLPVWCTNYLLGARRGGPSIGNVKERITPDAWRSFEAYCWRFLQAQVLLQRPRFVVVLGAFNREDLQVSNRLGPSPHGRHLFHDGTAQHSAVIAFADHPYSLIPNSRRQSAREAMAGLLSRS